jgi:hypothetical protein
MDLVSEARARAEKREIEDERNFRGFVRDARMLRKEIALSTLRQS